MNVNDAARHINDLGSNALLKYDQSKLLTNF